METAVMVRCVDPRFEGEWRKGLEALFEWSGVYTVTEPGGIYPLASPDCVREGLFISRIAEVVALAGASQLLVVHHANCARYAAKGVRFTDEQALNCVEERYHCGQMERGLATLIEAFPGLVISMHYMQRNGAVSSLQEVQRNVAVVFRETV